MFLPTSFPLKTSPVGTDGGASSLAVCPRSHGLQVTQPRCVSSPLSPTATLSWKLPGWPSALPGPVGDWAMGK